MLLFSEKKKQKKEKSRFKTKWFGKIFIIYLKLKSIYFILELSDQHKNNEYLDFKKSSNSPNFKNENEYTNPICFSKSFDNIYCYFVKSDSKWLKISRFVYNLVENKYYEFFITFTIVLSSIALVNIYNLLKTLLRFTVLTKPKRKKEKLYLLKIKFDIYRH